MTESDAAGGDGADATGGDRTDVDRTDVDRPGGEPLLAVRGLEKHYPVRSGLLRRTTGYVKAVDGVSFDVHEGETVGLVGESGCGKSTAATTILGLEEPTGGTVRFDGEDVSSFDADERTAFRRRAQIVFQDPNSAFDPRMTVAESVGQPLEIHGITNPHRRRRLVGELLELVGLSRDDLDRYSAAFSGGQKQRLALARALVLNPDLLVADEPVSALDVSVQAGILSLLDDLSDALGLSVLLISHDLGVVREICDRVVVMYLGEVVERAPTAALFDDSQHPYTRALLGSVPHPDPARDDEGVELTGDVPDPASPPAGCSFHPRCPSVVPPEDYDFGDGVYRAVLDLRLDAAAGHLAADTYDDPAAVRDAYDVPRSLSDPDAERVVADAVAAVADGDPAAAAERLAVAFTSVCERENPPLEPTDAGHPAACHLHDG